MSCNVGVDCHCLFRSSQNTGLSFHVQFWWRAREKRSRSRGETRKGKVDKAKEGGKRERKSEGGGRAESNNYVRTRARSRSWRARYVIIPFIITIRSHRGGSTGFHARFSLDGRKLPGTAARSLRAPAAADDTRWCLDTECTIVNRRLIRGAAPLGGLRETRTDMRCVRASRSRRTVASVSRGIIKF